MRDLPLPLPNLIWTLVSMLAITPGPEMSLGIAAGLAPFATAPHQKNLYKVKQLYTFQTYIAVFYLNLVVRK